MPILNWLTREQDIGAAARVPYRLLEEAPDFSAGDPNSGNILMQADNLHALKALLPFYAGRVKCIYIDPPYNTGSAFDQYDNNIEHTQWLAMMWPRLELLRDLLAEDGSIWISIDDNEGHYLKVIMDEMFGRSNLIANVVWQKVYTVKNSAKYLSDMHDHILSYARSKSRWSPNLLPRSDEATKNYSNPDNDPRGPWTTNAVQARNYYSLGTYEIIAPSGRVHVPPSGTYWRISKESFDRLNADERIWWGQDGDSIPRIKKFLSEAKAGVVPSTWWPHLDTGTNAEAKQEVRKLIGDDGEVFLTPKPEKLIRRILAIATNPGDLVLDSFLGSGTTAAVAHKMGRRYIGIEMGEHATTLCAPRLNKVIGGDQGGISKSIGWRGGDGFRFYRLGPPVFDEEGRIQPDVRFPVLAAHIWFSETNRPWIGEGVSPLLGLHDGHAYALLYNGILGDKRPGAGNVLTHATLRAVRELITKERPGFDGLLTVYGEQSRLAETTRERERILFKHTPYDVKARD